MEKIYLIYGLNHHKIKKETTKIINETQVDEYNLSFYDLEESPIQNAVNDLRSTPFISDFRVVVLQNAYFLSSNKPKNEPDHVFSTLKEYIASPVRTSVLIIEAPYEKLDSRKNLYKEIMDVACVIECKELSKEEKEKYIHKTILDQGYEIERNALLELIKNLQVDSGMINNELEKLFLYKMNDKKINLADVNELITKNYEDNIYDLLNAVVSRNISEVLRIYYNFINNGNDSVSVLGAITSKFQEILYTKELLKSGLGSQDIMKYFNATKGRAYYIMKNANEVKDNLLIRYIENLEKLDFDIKSGKIEKNIGIELFLLRL